MSGTAEYLEVFSKWKKTVGEILARADPQVLVRIIELSSAWEGISQRELQQALKINQPRLSKLTRKLAVCKWIELRTSSSDGRVVLMVATDHAKAKVEWLRQELSKIDLVLAQAAPKKAKAFKAVARPDLL